MMDTHTMGLLAAGTVCFIAEASSAETISATSSLFPGWTHDALINGGIAAAGGPVCSSIASPLTATASFISTPDNGLYAALLRESLASRPASTTWDQTLSPNRSPAATLHQASGMNLQDLESEFLRRVQRPPVAVEAGVLRAGMKPPACMPSRCSTSIGNLASMLALTPAGAAAMRAAHSSGSSPGAPHLLMARGSSGGVSYFSATCPAGGGSQRRSSGMEFDASGDSWMGLWEGIAVIIRGCYCAETLSGYVTRGA